MHTFPLKHSKNTGVQVSFLIIGVFLLVIAQSMIETVMKQSNLNSMSIDELFLLHERIAATLTAKINAEKKALIDRLKQADMRVH